MNMKLSELQAKRTANLAELEGMLNARDAAGVEFTVEQKAHFDALEAATHVLTTKSIPDAQKEENIRIQNAQNKANVKTPEEKVAEKFSFVKALGGLVKGRVEGVEREMSDEAGFELKRSGVSSTIEGVGIPSFLVNIKGSNVLGQTRDLTSGGTATGLEYVAELEKMHQYGLEISPKALQLGVEVWTGLTGNVYVNETGSASSVWEGETDANAETTPATSRPFTLSPKRLGAFADISKTLLAQTSGVAEERVKLQLQKAQNRKLDETIFQGTGIAPIPTGILATSNLNSTTGAVPDRQLFLDMWALIAADNADFDNLKVATTAAIYAFLQGAYIDAGSGRFLVENGVVNGVGTPVIYSNNIPANNILMGDFSKFVMGVWGGVDLVINPYTRAKENILEVVVNQFFDMGCLYPSAFCKVTDATLS
jgi:hypothetical protein